MLQSTNTSNAKFIYSKLIKDLMEPKSTMEKGKKLPSERQLCDDYDVSRTTVRNAIGSLVNAGILYQIQGKGIFVRDSEKENLSNYYSFTEQTRKNGKIPKSTVLSFKIRKANNKEKEIFAKDCDIKLIVFTRLRLADDIPMMYETTIIPYYRFKEIDKKLLENKPLYDIFEQDYDSNIYNIKERFSVSSMSKEIAKTMNLENNNPCLKIEGIHIMSKTNWLNIRNPMQELICSITKYHTGITNTYACMYQLNIGSVLV